MNWQNFSENIFQKVFIDSGSLPLSPVIMSMSIPFLSREAGAKLLLYNIQTKLYCTLFLSFFETFPQEADSQTDYGLRKEVANRQKECRYTLILSRARV